MNNEDIGLPPHLQRMVNAGVSGLDIMHGELKNLMLIAEQQLTLAQEAEDESEEAMDSMARTEAEGRLDALTELYQLTYQLSFAIGEAYDRELKAGMK
jgi:5-hydroxyisourate hydrolase-like protein (transthyretin family)